MITELQKAHVLYDLHTSAKDKVTRDFLWNQMWDLLMLLYKGNTSRVCYVTDLLLQNHLLKTYGYISCKKSDYKNHLLRGLDQYHW